VQKCTQHSTGAVYRCVLPAAATWQQCLLEPKHFAEGFLHLLQFYAALPKLLPCLKLSAVVFACACTVLLQATVNTLDMYIDTQTTVRPTYWCLLHCDTTQNSVESGKSQIIRSCHIKNCTGMHGRDRHGESPLASRNMSE
jgi:hypothetical protein